MEDEQRYYHILSKLFSMLVAICVSIAIPMTLLSTPIMYLVYGPSFASAGPILAVHVWAGLSVAMGLASTLWLVNEGLGHINMQRTLFGAVVNILINLWLIPVYHGLGAAIATVVAYSCTSFIWQLFFDIPVMRYIGIMQLQAFRPASWLRIIQLWEKH